jgi:enterochelin esterase-like enzyme
MDGRTNLRLRHRLRHRLRLRLRLRLRIWWVLVLMQVALSMNAQVPKVTSGKIDHIENFPSKLIEPRNIDIWVPDGYNPAKKYDVLYMHDGQMLFDSTITWNKKEWKVDEVMSMLVSSGKIRPCIIVGIWNRGADRIREYFPDKIYNLLDSSFRKMVLDRFCNGKPVTGDLYLKFLVNELKPYIDQHLPTLPGKDHTFIMGSSLGGLISVYAISEYPDIFGGAACLSTAWLSFLEPNYEMPLAVFDYLNKNLPTAENHKIYMDYGTGEGDKSFELTQSFVDLIAKGKGFTEKSYLSRVYDKAVHDEISWSRRLNVPIEFLLSDQ